MMMTVTPTTTTLKSLTNNSFLSKETQTFENYTDSILRTSTNIFDPNLQNPSKQTNKLTENLQNPVEEQFQQETKPNYYHHQFKNQSEHHPSHLPDFALTIQNKSNNNNINIENNHYPFTDNNDTINNITEGLITSGFDSKLNPDFNSSSNLENNFKFGDILNAKGKQNNFSTDLQLDPESSDSNLFEIQDFVDAIAKLHLNSSEFHEFISSLNNLLNSTQYFIVNRDNFIPYNNQSETTEFNKMVEQKDNQDGFGDYDHRYHHHHHSQQQQKQPHHHNKVNITKLYRVSEAWK